MASLAALVFRLERRIAVLEAELGITPANEDLMYPKAYTQEQGRVEQAKIGAAMFAAAAKVKEKL